MSRIGKLPISIPGGVTITVANDNTVTVNGPKGQLTEKFSDKMILGQENGVFTVKRSAETKENRALHGLTRTLINNMVTGVTNGFQKNLDINGVGYKAAKQGNKLVLSVGYSHPVEMVEPAGISYEVPAPNKIVVKGISKQLVGQMAADIRAVREPEPYKGKGIKYENEIVRRKEGKTGK